MTDKDVASMATAAAASALRQASETGIPCSPVRQMLGDNADEATAYAVQQRNTDWWIASGRRLVGRKIGLTAKSVQQQLGVDQPDYGALFADMCIDDCGEVPWNSVMQPKVEAEIALVLENDLDIEMPTVADVIRAVAFAMPAIEIVGSRIANWDISFVDTVADNASSGLYVLGGPAHRLPGLDLKRCEMQMLRSGSACSTGRGDACLGSPLNAATWLARKMSRIGNPLRTGDVILTGALGPMVTVAPGDLVEAQIAGVGSVKVSFAAGA